MNITKADVTSMIDDTVRILTIIAIIHFMSYAIDNKEDLLCERILKEMLYTTIGIILFHSFIKKIKHMPLLPNLFK